MSEFSTLVTDCIDPNTLGVFGDDVEYFPTVGTPYTLTGVLSTGEDVQVNERVYATLWAPITGFTEGEPRKGDKLTFNSITYRVADIKKDSMGGRLLDLAVTNP